MADRLVAAGRRASITIRPGSPRPVTIGISPPHRLKFQGDMVACLPVDSMPVIRAVAATAPPTRHRNSPKSAVYRTPERSRAR
jgi:hypothetical protein